MTSASPGTLHIVQRDDGWLGRVKGANFEKVWGTEILESKDAALNAILVLIATVKGQQVDTFSLTASGLRVIEVDERTDTTPPEAFAP